MKIRELPDGIKLYYSFLDMPMEQLLQEYKWGTFTINGKTLCRTGCFQGTRYPDGTVPWLRCENQTIERVTQTTELLQEKIKAVFGYNTNIFKVQLYRDGRAGIHVHSDKIVDLERDTPIFIIRWGATITAILVEKDSESESASENGNGNGNGKDSEKDSPRELRVEMPHGSLLVIPYSANLKWKHGILKDQTVVDNSISIVARNSNTFTRNDSEFIVGGNDHEISKDQQRKQLIESFSIENKYT